MRVSLKAMVVIGAAVALTWTSATQARDVVIGYSGRTIAEMPFAWGSRKGFFKEANLDVKMIYMSTSIAAKGLMSGDVDYSTAMGGTLRAAIAGAPLIGIYSMFKAQMYLVAQPRYKQVVDLKGKTVGISVFGGAYDLVARTILKHHGLDPERQVTLLQIGDSRTLYSALAAGTIDSAILGPPYDIRAELEGNNRLFDSSEIFDMPFSGLATSKKKLQQDRAEVKAIVRGLERIRRYIAANRPEAEAFVKQFLNLNDKEARLSVAQMVKSFRDSGRTTDEAVVDFIETTLRSTKQKAGSIKPNDIVDWSVTTEVVRELDKEKK
jgi:NitT/TauT family transport system substrate-binding protein